MEQANVLNNVKILLSIEETDTTKDALLNLFITKAVSDLKSFCNRDFLDEAGVESIPEPLESIIEDLVVYRYNSRGSDGGIQSKKLGSMSITYASATVGEFPEWILQRLYPYRLMKVW